MIAWVFQDGRNRARTCTQLTLHVHEIMCAVLIENTVDNYLSPAHVDHYALRQ